ncbi:hypothetical protein IJ556_06525 [bacterium]|nr:hypothetical protein [bacterium]
MIEMLGVLAIIGVLTVGSITGYSRAMRRHLLNKQREQISYILSAVETNYDMLNLADLHNRSSNPTKTFETLGWIPEEMIKDNSNYIYDVFKNRISFYVWAYLYMGLTINITNNIPREQCINLYQMIQSYHSSLWLTEVATYDPKGLVSMNNAYYGDQYCVGGPKCIRNLTPAEISSMCHVCDNYDRCIFYIFWR